ncbi:MAG: FAD-binding oxidoreductase [Ectothiorhodospiraceae bacterium]|nr:FAD-binding oxidoreductase [Ectothiorhodospiraceae bacterium]MCH8502727.1 FAD-binding oxidoreductase [Ectothiorhodospiraceae bacterium]
MAEWIARIGDEAVIDDPTELQRRSRATFGTYSRLLGIIRPAGVEQVRACLDIARRYSVPVYPCSTGKNWGYGSMALPGDGVALLLDRMNRIRAYDDELGTVTVEPGVTQRQLHDYLAQQGGRYWQDVTGSSADCSVLGNTVERGFGHTPYADHFANVCGLEVITATGRVVRTGFQRFHNAQAAHAYKWGVGPYLDGLFSQSGLGVVTAITLWLMPRPEAFQYFQVSVRDDADLEPLIDTLRELRMEGSVQSAVHIANRFKVFSAMEPYPWEALNGETPLPETYVEQRLRQLRLGAWSFSGALYGTRQGVALARKRIRRQLRGRVHIQQMRFMNPSRLALLDRFKTPLSRLTGLPLERMLGFMQVLFGIKQGVPTNRMLASVYWRKRTPPPADPDPDRDGCGLFWCAPVAPLKGADARAMVTIANTVFARHGFEPMLSMTVISERALDNVIALHYDRDIPGEDERAFACYEELLNRMMDAGYYPYRLGIQSMEALRERSSSEWNHTLADIRQALDPDGILAPGRYPA